MQQKKDKRKSSDNYMLKEALLFIEPTKAKILITSLLDVIIIASLLYFGENIVWIDVIQGLITISLFGYISVSFVEAVVRYIEKL